MDDCQAAVEKLQSATSTQQELDALTNLQHLMISNYVVVDDMDSVEREFLTGVQDSNPFPEKTIHSLFHSNNELKRFTFYVFDRRYGWSENIKDGRRVRIRRLGSVISGAVDERVYKAELNEKLDLMLRWLQHQVIDEQLAESLVYCLEQAAEKPVVRQQTVIHTMDWLCKHKHHLHNVHFGYVKDLILSGVVDVWSAIRKSAVTKLGVVAESLRQPDLLDLLKSLHGLGLDPQSSWQAKEGAVMGLNSILKRFQCIGDQPDVPLSNGVGDQPDLPPSNGVANRIRKPCWGTTSEDWQPHPLSSAVRELVIELVYPLLSHEQVTIREHTTKMFSTYLMKCDANESEAALAGAMTRLCRGCNDTWQPQVAITTNGDHGFLDAHTAEGILGICLFVVKNINGLSHLDEWLRYLTIFDLYLSHPASTVRQATSTIVKYIVVKELCNVDVPQRVLMTLCGPWHVDQSQFTLDHVIKREYIEGDIHKPHSNGLTHCHNEAWCNGNKDGDEHSTGCAPLTRVKDSEHCKNFIALNGDGNGCEHCATETVLDLRGDTDLDLPKRDSNERPRRHLESASQESAPLARRNLRLTSVTEFHRFPPGDVCHCWEWREGRLFAYELILKFLIKNHWIYTFGVYAGTSECPHSSSTGSFDDGVISRDSITPDAKHSRKRGDRSRDGRALYRHCSVPVALTSSAVRVNKLRGDLSASNINSLLVQSETTVEMSSSPCPNQIPTNHHDNVQASLSNQFLVEGCRSFLQRCQAVERDVDMDGGLHNSGLPNGGPGDSGLSNGGPGDSGLYNGGLANGDPGDSGLSNGGLSNGGPSDSGLGAILRRILEQTMESLADPRWEVRRMADQVMPCICEVVRLYDMTILTTAWNHYLSSASSVRTYGLCVALQSSVSHVIKLIPLLNDPPATWQDVDGCSSIVRAIIDPIQANVQTWSTVLCRLLVRPVYDKLTSVSLQTLLLIHAHLSLEPRLKHDQEQSVTTILGHVLSLSATADDSVSITPWDGFLSCCTVSGDAARRVEAHMFHAVKSSLVHFLRSCDVRTTAPLLRTFVTWVEKTANDVDDCKLVVEWIGNMAVRTNEYFRQTTSGHVGADDIVRCMVESAMRHLAVVVCNKSLDTYIMRNLTEIYVIFTAQLPKTDSLKCLFRAILQMKNEVGGRLASITDAEADELLLLSNDIRAANQQSPALSDDENDNDAFNGHVPDDVLRECSNVLSNSGNNCRLSTSEVSCASGSPASSDMDDWDDDEEEDTSASVDILCGLLRKLKVCHAATTPRGSISLFDKELTLLDPGDCQRLRKMFQ